MKFNFNQTQFDEQLKNKGATVLFKTISADLITPIQASLKLFAQFQDYHFLLESAQNNKDGKNSKGRFCVIGVNPDKVFKCFEGRSFINNSFHENRENFTEQNSEVLQNFRAFFQEAQIDFSDLNYRGGALPAITSGVFGYFGYEMIHLMEKIERKEKIDEIKIPDAIYSRPQILVVFDNFFDSILICAPIFRDHHKSYEKACAEILQIEEILLGESEASANRKRPTPSNSSSFHFTSSHSQEEYCAMVDECKKFIIDGDIFQILPSQKFTSNFDKSISEFAFYRSLRNLNPSPFLFYFKFEDFALTGSSPEIMVSLKDTKVTIRPLAGTRKRGASPEEDQEIAAELLNDEKELAEHLMLIDLGRHDVGRVCKAGSVKTTQKMVIEFYSHVMHISSNVEGEIRDDLDALDALISGFPAGTVSGAPKIRAMEILNDIEKIKRGFYAGCAGYFSSNGDMETCILLRSCVIKDGKINLHAGAGVVFDSDPKSEHQECYNKASALMRACERVGEFV